MSDNQEKSHVVLGAEDATRIRGQKTVVINGGSPYRRAARALLTGQAVLWKKFVLKFPNKRAEKDARTSVLAPARLGMPLPQDRTLSAVFSFSQEGKDILKKADIKGPAYIAAARARTRSRTRPFVSGNHATAG